VPYEEGWSQVKGKVTKHGWQHKYYGYF
jgi:hypothetical protein